MSASDWRVISEADLSDLTSSGGWIRAYCPIHGGDHQRSLSINETSGFGRCHQCGAQVLLREINPTAAANIARYQAPHAIKVRDPKHILRASTKTPAVKPWQQEEITLLRELQPHMEAHLRDARARTYLAERRISLVTAERCHAGYIPDVPLIGKYAPLARWTDRIIFPVQSKENGVQFVGRSLKLWKPGMDEGAHKALLDRLTMTRRWIKTHATGWLNFQAMEQATRIIFVEGAFDALAPIEAGLANTIAVIGTTLDVRWLPQRRAHLCIALDGDESGRTRSEAARQTCYEHGYDVTLCPVPADGLGKDWSERYRLHGRSGLLPLLEAS